MKVLVPKLSGFCPGVKAAENRIFNEIIDHPEVRHSVLGMMINNSKYISYLDENGVSTADKPESLQSGDTVFIRTHGIDRSLQNKLEMDFRLIDLTCRNVKKVQMIIEKHSKLGAAVFITGKKSHPEVLGLQSYGQFTKIFETEDEIRDFISNPELNGREFNPRDYSELFITSQTTASRRLFTSAIELMKKKWPDAVIDSFDSICPVTEKKEKEALRLQKEAEISFVIGDPLSSNAGKLFTILKNADERTWFIQDVDELKGLELDLGSIGTALVVSSASTPRFVEDKVVNFLENLRNS